MVGSEWQGNGEHKGVSATNHRSPSARSGVRTPEWHHAREGQKQGPISFADLSALASDGRLRPEDWVWKAGMGEWALASSISDLAEHFRPPTSASEPPPPPLPTRNPAGASAPANVPAAHLARFAAALIDTVVLFAISIGVFTTLAVIGIASLDGAVMFVPTLMGLIYMICMPLTASMGTLGKMAAGLIIVNTENGGRISWGQSVGRALTYWIPAFFVLPLLAIVFSRRRQGLHDMLAGTLVLRKATYRQDAFDLSAVRGESNVAVAVVAIVVLLLPVAGILAAIAIPAYQDYSARATVEMAVTEAEGLRPTIAARLSSTNWAEIESYEDIGVDGAIPAADGRALIDFNSDGVIFVTFNSSANVPLNLRGGEVVLTPVRDGAGVRWRCGSESVAAAYLPARCR